MAQNMDIENNIRIESIESMEKNEINESPTNIEETEEASKPSNPKKTAIVNIPMCIACVLFCLTLVSIRLTSGLYARYVNTASGSSSARVISFGNITLRETGNFASSGSAKIIPGVNLKKQVQISFTGSESATYVFVEITPTGGWTTGDNATFSMLNAKMQWRVATGTTGWTFLSSSGGTYVYYKMLGPNTPLSELDVIANEGEITVSDQITSSELQALEAVSITLRASVVQAGGFADAAAAWASISGS